MEAVSMARLNLTKVEPALMAYLTASAKETGRTIEEVAIEAIANGVKLDKAGLVALTRKARSLQRKPISDDSTGIVRRMRDAS
jgi:hypothetical protein